MTIVEISRLNLLSEGALLFLADINLKTVVTYLVAVFAIKCQPKLPAACRHFIWLAALAICFLMLFLSAVAPRRALFPYITPVQAAIKVSPDSAAPQSPDLAHITALNIPPPTISSGAAGSETPPDMVTSGSSFNSPTVQRSALVTDQPVCLAGLGLMIIGSLICLARQLISLLRLRTLSRTVVIVTSGKERDLLDHISRRTNLNRHVILLRSTDNTVRVPMTWGTLHPRIVLPTSSEGWPVDQMTSALLHEVGHISRKDWPVQLLTSIYCAVLWFNPVTWLIARHIRDECEAAADDFAISQGIENTSYAANLLAIASLLKRCNQTYGLTLPIVPSSKIEKRIKMILLKKASRNQIGTRAVVTIAAASLMAVIALSVISFIPHLASASEIASGKSNSRIQSSTVMISTAPNGSGLGSMKEEYQTLHYLNSGPWPSRPKGPGRQAELARAEFAKAIAKYNLAYENYYIADHLTFDSHTPIGHSISRRSTEKAIPHLRIAVALEPNVPGFQMELAELLYFDNRPAAAFTYDQNTIRLYRSLYTARPTPLMLTMVTSQIANTEDSAASIAPLLPDYKLSIAYRQDAIKLHGQVKDGMEAEDLLLLGKEYESAGDIKDARIAWNRIVSLPASPPGTELNYKYIEEQTSKLLAKFTAR